MLALENDTSYTINRHALFMRCMDTNAFLSTLQFFPGFSRILPFYPAIIPFKYFPVFLPNHTNFNPFVTQDHSHMFHFFFKCNTFNKKIYFFRFIHHLKAEKTKYWANRLQSCPNEALSNAYYQSKIQFWYIYGRNFTKYICVALTLHNILMIFGKK